MIVALTGGTGFVGQAVLDVLEREGIAVRALARNVPSEQRAQTEWISGGLSDRASLDRLVQGTDCILHIAGLTTSIDPAELHLVNVEGTSRLLDATGEAGIDRFVFVSSLAAREPDLSAYGKSKAEAERLVAQSGLAATVVRPPAVYGPRDKDMIELFRAARWGVVPMPPPGRSSLIHVDDLADCLLALLRADAGMIARTFEVDDGRAGGWSHRELAKAIGRAVGRDPFVPHLSRGVLAGLSRLDRLFRGGRAKLTADRVGYMTHPDWVIDGERRLPPDLWSPHIPSEEGLTATARWYRERGWL